MDWAHRGLGLVRIRAGPLGWYGLGFCDWGSFSIYRKCPKKMYRDGKQGGVIQVYHIPPQIPTQNHSPFPKHIARRVPFIYSHLSLSVYIDPSFLRTIYIHRSYKRPFLSNSYRSNPLFLFASLSSSTFLLLL